MHDSTFHLPKVKANLQAMKKHLANFRELGGGGEERERGEWMCVCVRGRGGVMTLHRPLILSERVIIAIKAGWAIEAVCVLAVHASTSLIK